MIMWFSNEFKETKNLNTNCLHKNAISEIYSHDNFFHSVLGIMNIETNEYNSTLDIFAPCRK